MEGGTEGQAVLNAVGVLESLIEAQSEELIALQDRVINQTPV